MSAVYETISRLYDIPVINITEIFLREKGRLFVESLYDSEEDEPGHYSRPDGVKQVADLILREILSRDLLNTPLSILGKYPTVQDNNFQHIRCIDRVPQAFLRGDRFKSYEFSNSLIKENVLEILPGSSIQFELKGNLIAILLKSDINDGFISVKFGSQKIITSTFSTWVGQFHDVGLKNILGMITLPVRRFKPSRGYSKLSISICANVPNQNQYELDFWRGLPTRNPDDWTLGVVSLVYLGETRPLA